MKISLLLTVALLSAGCTLPRPEYAFTCTDDQPYRATEYQEHVHHARVEADSWELEYSNGRKAYYRQPAGETCWLERVL